MSHGGATATRAPRAAAVLVLFLALPWLVLYWLSPAWSSLSIGIDYPRYSIAHQLILQFSLRNGTTPMFVPGFAYGNSVGAATLGQLFHPISHLAALLPGYWTGGALRNYTALNLLSLGLAGWVLFRTLRGIAVGAVPAFLAAFIAVFNLRMLDFFRYGAALQNYVGFVVTGAVILHLAAHGPSAGRLVLLAVATALLICGGHPQAAYVSMLGVGVLALAAPHLVAELRPRRATPLARRWSTDVAVALLGLGAGVLLSAAYLLPFVLDFALDAPQRTGNDFRWTYFMFGTKSATSLLHSVFKPLSSDVHGSFAGSALFAIPLLVPVLRLLRPLPGVVWALWTVSLVVLCAVLAEQLPLYFVLWKVLPGFSAFRVPGRLTTMLPLLMALVLVWVMQAERVALRAGRRTLEVAPGAVLGVLAAAVYAVYGLLAWPQEASELSPPVRINRLAQSLQGPVYGLGIAALLLFAWHASRRSRAAAAALLLVVIAQQTLVLRAGTWVVEAAPSRTYQDMAWAQQRAIGFHGDAGAGMESATIAAWRRHLREVRQVPRLATLHWSEHEAASQADAFEWVKQRRQSTTPAVEAPADGGDPPATGEAQGRGTVVLEHATFNRLRFAVGSSEPALLRVAYPHSGRWLALVDGREQRPLRVDGAWLGVRVPRGASTVELRFVSPATLWGMVVTCLTACVIGCAWALTLPRRSLRLAACFAIVAVVVSGFLVWERSLYGGRHLGTAYRWSEEHKPTVAGVRSHLRRSDGRAR